MENLILNLTKLKEMGCVGIKTSYEDEGALLNEVISMRSLTSRLGVDLYLKIGGCEAKRDIVEAIELNCDGIVGPMIESAFSLDKFISSCKQYKYSNAKGINLETIGGYNNFNTIIPKLPELDFITLGRVDFVGSLNKDRNYVDSNEILEIAKNIFKEAKKNNILCCLGGAISIKSKEFIRSLVEENLLDKFETRYIIFSTKNLDIEKLDEMLFLANVFEVEWLKYISNRYLSYSNKDKKRIEMIEDRISNNSKKTKYN